MCIQSILLTLIGIAENCTRLSCYLVSRKEWYTIKGGRNFVSTKRGNHTTIHDFNDPFW